MDSNQLNGKLESLQERVQALMRESEDKEFTEYLNQMRARVIHQRYQLDLLADELEKRYQMYRKNLQSRPQQQIPPTIQTVTPQETTQPVVQPVLQEVPQTVQMPAPQKKTSVEFTIGAAVLSIVGCTFILIALALFGIHFMSNFVMGMVIYVLFLSLTVVSELLVCKKGSALGTGMSAVGMGGLYVTNMINYLGMHNYNMWVAVGVVFVLTVALLILSKRKNSVTYRILGITAVYICILMVPLSGHPAADPSAALEFFAITVVLFAMSVLCLALPVRKSYSVINVTHMALNTLFMLFACYLWVGKDAWTSILEMWYYPVLLGVSLLAMQLIYVVQIRQQAKQKPDATLADNAGICITYGISAFFYMLMTVRMTDFANLLILEEGGADIFWIYRLICAVAVISACLIPLVLLRGRQEKWLAWYLMGPLLLAVYIGAGGGWEMAGCMAFLVAVVKILSFRKNIILGISDALLTFVACLMVLFEHRHVYVLPLFAVLLLSVLCIHYWQVYYEIVLSFTIALFTTMHMLPMLKLPVFVGILFVGILLFNNVTRWRSKEIVIYNVIAVMAQAVCFMQLMSPVYYKAYLTYLCMLIFGVSTIIICFQENYKMNFALKRLVLVFFLTYMAVLVQTSYPVINSILMMGIALLSVWIGFAEQKKEVRIYGLALSFVVCAKIVFYDFYEVSTLQKTILFFVAGVLALAISAIYMVLERKQSRKQAESESEKVQEGWTEE